MSLRLKHRTARETLNVFKLIQNEKSIARNYQQTILTDTHPEHTETKCICQVCAMKRTLKKHSKLYHSNQQNQLLQTFINCLIDTHNIIQINIPYVCFFKGVTNGTLWRTNNKSGFLEKEPTYITERNLYSIFKNFSKEHSEYMKIWGPADTEPTRMEINELEYNRVLPTVRTKGGKLDQRKLVLYRNKDEMSDSERVERERQFCIIKYLDGNFQLMSQLQFRNLASNLYEKVGTIDYIKSYIKPKSPPESTIIVSFDSQILDLRMYEEVNHQLSFLLDEIIQLDPKYLNPEDYKLKYCQSQLSQEQFLKFKTYEIVLFIQKSCLRKTNSIQIHWLLSESDSYYVYDVLHWDYQDKWLKVEPDRKMFLESCLDDKFPKVLGMKVRESMLQGQSMKGNVVNKHQRSLKIGREKRQMRLNPEVSLELRRGSRSLKNNKKSERFVREKFKLEPLRLMRGRQELTTISKASRSIQLAPKLSFPL